MTLQLVGVTPALILNVEPLVGRDTEVSAALRLLERVREELPRFIDVANLPGLFFDGLAELLAPRQRGAQA